MIRTGGTFTQHRGGEGGRAVLPVRHTLPWVIYLVLFGRASPDVNLPRLRVGRSLSRKIAGVSVCLLSLDMGSTREVTQVRR